jgi:hypothetical protein
MDAAELRQEEFHAAPSQRAPRGLIQIGALTALTDCTTVS